MSNTRKLWLLTIFSCVTLVSGGAFADNYGLVGDGVSNNSAYTDGRKIVTSKAYSDLKNDQLKLDINTKEASVNKQATDNGATTITSSSDDTHFPTSKNVYEFVQGNPGNWITANDVPAQQNANWDAASGVTQITNKPTIDTAATGITNATNDAAGEKHLPTSYAVQQYVQGNPGNWITANDVPAQQNANWAETDNSSVAYIMNKPGDFTGANDADPGATGLVPAPAAKANKRYLSGNGSWQFVKVPVSTAEPTDNNTTDLASIWVQ